MSQTVKMYCLLTFIQFIDIHTVGMIVKEIVRGHCTLQSDSSMSMSL